MSSCRKQIDGDFLGKRIDDPILPDPAGHVQIKLVNEILAPGALRQDFHDQGRGIGVVIFFVQMLFQIADDHEIGLNDVDAVIRLAMEFDLVRGGERPARFAPEPVVELDGKFHERMLMRRLGRCQQKDLSVDIL